MWHTSHHTCTVEVEGGRSLTVRTEAEIFQKPYGWGHVATVVGVRYTVKKENQIFLIYKEI